MKDEKNTPKSHSVTGLNRRKQGHGLQPPASEKQKTENMIFCWRQGQAAAAGFVKSDRGLYATTTSKKDKNSSGGQQNKTYHYQDWNLHI